MDKKHQSCTGSKIPLKIVLLGGPNVGKSALTVRFLTNRFIYDYRSDTDLMYTSCKNVNGQDIPIEILDTSSNSSELSTSYLEWADVIVILYSITDVSSFEITKKYIDILCERKTATSTLILGTKSDMEHMREVNLAQGEELASKCNFQFSEVSALSEYTSLQATLTAFIESLDISSIYKNSSNCSTKYPSTIKHPQAKSLFMKQKVNVSKMLGLFAGKISNKSPAPITQLVALDKTHLSRTKYPIRQL